MELSELRKKIDKLDDSIREKLLERFDLAREVGLSKIQSGSKVIYRKDREDEILSKMTEGLDKHDAGLLRETYRNIMLYSRNIQYRLIEDNFDNILEDKVDGNSLDIKMLICQGICGAYSHLAALKLGNNEIAFEDTFKDVFNAIDDDVYGVLPLDNSTQGMVSEVYDLLLQHGYYIVKSIDLPIKHVAMAKPGARKSDIHFITAHNQALSQCSTYIDNNALQKISATNNAVAARDVATGERYDICCLGDRSNADRYGLEIIDENVNNSLTNTTRFIVVGNKLIAPDNGGKVSIVFSMDNSSGTLANVLNIISSYGMSMSKIESRPIKDDKWEYRFFVDIEGNIRDKDMKALLFELKSELPFMKVLGSYDELM